ncbi:MAG: hypothetical protein JXR96_03935 [Deltaproteobacteria bacterium]|nr:hypothetical protein [Deltaproteobacteria bacterium]
MELAKSLVLLAFIAVYLVIFLPRIVTALKTSAIRFGAADPSDRQRHDAMRAKHASTLEELSALGFESIGVVYEKPPAAARIWQIALASRRRRSFASVGRWTGRKRNVFFLTTFTNGAVICTRLDAGGAIARQTDMFIDGGLTGGTVAEVLQLHESRVEQFVKQGYTTVGDYSLEGRLEAFRAYYRNPELKKKFRKEGLVHLVNLLVMVGMLVYFTVDKLS